MPVPAGEVHSAVRMHNLRTQRRHRESHSAQCLVCAETLRDGRIYPPCLFSNWTPHSSLSLSNKQVKTTRVVFPFVRLSSLSSNNARGDSLARCSKYGCFPSVYGGGMLSCLGLVTSLGFAAELWGNVTLPRWSLHHTQDAQDEIHLNI